MIDKELLRLLICPACGEGSALTPLDNPPALQCERCSRQYPVRHGIPVMLVDEAERPEDNPDKQSTAGNSPENRDERS